MQTSKAKADIEQLLRSGQSVQFYPTGWSMYPLIINGRDQAVVVPVGDRKLRRGDVVLYRREGSILVLHRIVRVRPEGYYMVGDNQKEIEGPLRPEQMLGVMTHVIRKGRTISVNNLLYRLYSGIWLLLRPVRPAISRTVAAIRRPFRRKNSK